MVSPWYIKMIQKMFYNPRTTRPEVNRIHVSMPPFMSRPGESSRYTDRSTG